MSPISDSLERLASHHGIDILEVQEFWAERASIRQHLAGMTREIAEVAALDDVTAWLQERAARTGRRRAG